MTLPRILVVDDELGACRDRRNSMREDFCAKLAIADVTGDVAAESIRDPLCEGVFCSAQEEQGGVVENNKQQAIALIRRAWATHPRWALVLLDLYFKTGNVTDEGTPAGRPEDLKPESYFGLTLLRELRSDPGLGDLPVTILSSKERSEIEKLFADLDACDFVRKGELTRDALQQQLFYHGLLEDERILGHSVSLLKCLREARRRAVQGNGNVLVLGESGTGKEMLAQYIHEKSGRRGPFVKLFTQGTPESLIEDQLFGHEKGAFTDARSAREGAAEQADGGTLFIDEFGNVPGGIQAKLLRLLDKNTRESQRIGSQEARQLDLVVVMATNRLDIGTAADFRADLLARANVGNPVLLPSVRDRPEDLPLLIEHLVRRAEVEQGADRREIGQEALARLLAYHWPHNVRELDLVLGDAVRKRPRIRHLAANHLRLPGALDAAVVPAPAPEPPPPGSPARVGPDLLVPGSLGLVLLALERADPGADWETYEGRLGDVQVAYVRFFARWLKVALETTRTRTPGKRAGRILITTAMKHLTGDPNLKAPQAADLIKRVLRLRPDVAKELLADPVLAEAYEKALQMRPQTRAHARGD